MESNFCDDYYLWINMFSENRTFVMNPETLYEHTWSGRNQSSDSYEWVRSTHELMHIVREEHLLLEEERLRFLESRERHIEKEMRALSVKKTEAEVLGNMFRFGFSLLRSLLHGFLPEEVAIYCYRTGILLFRIMEETNFKVSCILDQNATNLQRAREEEAYSISVLSKEDTPGEIRCVIETLFRPDFKEELRSYYRCVRPDIVVVDICDVYGSK